jgi:hypothetical protein
MNRRAEASKFRSFDASMTGSAADRQRRFLLISFTVRGGLLPRILRESQGWLVYYAHSGESLLSYPP